MKMKRYFNIEKLKEEGGIEFTNENKKFIVVTEKYAVDNSIVDSEQLSFIRKGLAVIFHCTVSGYDYIIIVSDAVMSSGDRDTINSILYHEMGHGMNNDAFVDAITFEEKLRKEVNADRYAKENGFAQDLANFLISISNNYKDEETVKAFDLRIEYLLS